MSWLQDPHPEVEIFSPPLAQPIHRPSLVPSITDDDNDEEALVRRKRESYNMTGSVFLITSAGKTLNLPVPSDSKDDPLNWGRWKTAGAIGSLAWYTVTSSVVIQASSVVLPGIMEEYKGQEVKPWTMESLVTAPTLFMGIGALLWLPLSLGLGRRPVFLLVALMMTIATLGAGFAANFQQLFVCVCFFGLGHGFSVTSAFLMVIDMTFIHQRPKAVALLWSLLGAATGGLALVPSLSSQGTSWRHFYYYWSIPTGISFFLALALYPETYFKRPTVAFDGLIVLQSATEKVTVYKDTEADSDIYRDLPDLPSSHGLLNRLRCSRSLFASWKSVAYCYAQMMACAINPLIFWVLLASSIHWAGILFIGATYAETIRSPPYNLPFYLVLNVYVASCVGALVAYPVGGWLTDKILKRLARRNNGVREAEHFLVGYIAPAIAGAFSTGIYGYAVEYKLHYSFYYLSSGLAAFAWVTLSISNTLWVTEAFPRWAAPAVAVSGGACYVLSFCVGFALLPWISAHGFKLVGVELAVLQIVAGLIIIPIAFWGKSARQAIHGRWADERAGALRPL